MSKHPEDHSEFLEVRRELDSLLYDIALLCHAGYIEQPSTGEIGDMLRKISDAHTLLQLAKSERFTSLDDMKRLRRIRRDETLALVRNVRRRKMYVDLPPGISDELQKYDALSRRLESLIHDAPQHEALNKAGRPVIGTPPSGSKARRKSARDSHSKNAPKRETKGEREADSHPEEELHITGLDSVPDVGDPLDFLKLSPPAPSMRLWIKNQLDNTDIWIGEHQTVTLRAMKTLAIVLICFNLLAIHWFIMATYDAPSNSGEPAVAVNAPADTDAEEVSRPSTAPFIRGALGVLTPFLIVVGSLVAVWVCWDDKPKQYIRELDLDKVKRTLIPFDPVNTAVESFWRGFWSGETLSAAAVRERDQSLHSAQLLSTGLLVLLLVYPFAQTKVSAMATVDDADVVMSVDAESEDSDVYISNAEAETANPSDSSPIKDRLRRKYLWMTAVLALLAGLSVLVMWLRQASAIGREGAAYLGFSPKVAASPDEGRTMVDMANPEGTSLYSREGAEIDHGDPYGAMARSVRDNLTDHLLGRSLWVDVKLARYRLLNRWRFLYIMAFMIQHSFRFIGVIVFVGMLLISVVMPLVFLSSVQNQAKSEYHTFRALADPFLNDEADIADDVLAQGNLERSLSDDARAKAESQAVAQIDRQGERAVEAQQHSRASLYYIVAVLALVLVNVGLAVARVLHRGRNWRVLRSAKGDLKSKAAFAGLGLMLAFLSWGDGMRFSELKLDFTNLHDEDGRVVSQVRKVREAAHFKQKAITALLAPPAFAHQVWYVDGKRGAASHVGTSWEHACSDIQAAINNAAAAGGGEVWVATGVYRLNVSADGQESAERSMLHVHENVRVFGGFVGGSSLFPEAHRRERNWTSHPTILITSAPRGPENVEGLVVLDNGAMLDGFSVISTKMSESGSFLTINPTQRFGKPAIIGNSKLLLFDGQNPLPILTAGGSSLVHGCRFPQENDGWPYLNARVTVAPNCVVIPRPKATVSEHPPRNANNAVHSDHRGSGN